MAFNTAGFLFLFFPAAFLLYRLLPGRRTKNLFLALASAVFYGFGGLASLPVLFAAFLWDYLFGRLIAKDEKRAKLWCGIAAAGKSDFTALAPGVAGALLTTVAGLIVAIPSLVGYNLLTATIRNLTVTMDNFTEEFMVRIKLEQLALDRNASTTNTPPAPPVPATTMSPSPTKATAPAVWPSLLRP